MTDLVVIDKVPNALALAGRVADRIAADRVFDNYRERKAPNTLRRQDAGLELFKAYLADAGVTAGDLARDPEAWRGVTWGLVAGFVRWQVLAGYAVSSVNVRLSTVKVYARLALLAGGLSADAYAAIRAVQGYSRKEGKRVDDDRKENGLPTRAGHKKAEPVGLTKEQARALKAQPTDTPQGRRDGLLMCLLLDHGLRVGEVAGLTVTDLDLKAGELRFYRPKVDKVQVHRLTADALRAATIYLANDAPAIGPLLRAGRKDGRLHDAGMSARAITARVRELGEAVGVKGLSAHDCRHYWATRAAREGTPIDRLQDAGGWASPAMPLRYVEAAKIANEGVKLG
jgi:integrase